MSSPYPKPAQSVFDLGVDPAHDRASLLVSDSNRAAVEWIDKWPDWPTHALALHGPASSGKTHLGEIWRNRAQALLITPPDLSQQFLADISDAPQSVVLDGADETLGNPAYEQGLFHLYNLLKETRRYLLLIGRSAPARWKVKLPDLASRLGAVPIIGIEQPDDSLLTILLAKLLSDRQLIAGPEILSYLVPRMERSFAAADKIVADLDRLSLAHKRPLTVALARMALEEAA